MDRFDSSLWECNKCFTNPQIPSCKLHIQDQKDIARESAKNQPPHNWHFTQYNLADMRDKVLHTWFMNLTAASIVRTESKGYTSSQLYRYIDCRRDDCPDIQDHPKGKWALVYLADESFPMTKEELLDWDNIHTIQWYPESIFDGKDSVTIHGLTFKYNEPRIDEPKKWVQFCQPFLEDICPDPSAHSMKRALGIAIGTKPQIT